MVPTRRERGDVELEKYASTAREHLPRRTDIDISPEGGEPMGTVTGALPRARVPKEARREEFPLMHQMKRLWKSMIAIALTACALGVGASLLLPEQYDAEAKIMVSVNSAQDVNALSQGNDFSRERVQTYIDVATSRPVLDAVIAELSLETTPEELAEKVTAEAVPETVLLRLVVRDESPEMAARIANAVAGQLMSQIDELERGGEGTTALVRTVLVEPASAPAEASTPSIPRNAVFALLAGVAIAVLYVYLRGTLDTRIRTAEALSEGLELPLLAKIPRGGARASDPTLMTEHDPTGFSESYRLLRTRLRYANADGKLDTIMVTSVSEGEGKSSVSSLLATACAESGMKVLLIDADLRRSSIADRFGLEKAVGLSAVLTRQATLDEAVQHSRDTGVDVLAAGMLPPNPAELLESQTMNDLLLEAKRGYDLVLIDTPPVASTADATSVSTIADAVLFVVRTDGRVSRRSVERALDGMSFVGSRVLGVVATFVKMDKVESARYY